VHSPAHSSDPSVSVSSFDGALQNADLLAESEDLELKRRTAAEGSE
jgi:hypothetical protein